MFIFGYIIIFRVMGELWFSSFASALCGFGMGSTANAVANMDAIQINMGLPKLHICSTNSGMFIYRLY